MYYLVPFLIVLVLGLVYVITSIPNDMALTDSTLLGLDNFSKMVRLVIYLVIMTLILIFVGPILMYGLTACGMDIRRGKTVGFKTIFKKIKKRLGKVIKLILWSMLDIVIYGLILIISTLLFAFSANVGIGLLVLLSGILLIGAIAFFVYKLMQLSLSIMWAYYLIYDYPDKTARQILKKAKYIEGKVEGKYITLILSNVWILPILILNILLASKIDWLIFQPKLQIGGSYISNTPVWWSVATLLFRVCSVLFLVMKTLSLIGSMYESIEPESLFDEDYKFEKQEKKYVFTGLGLIIFYIAVTFLLAWCFSNLFENLFYSRWPKDSFTITDGYGNDYNYYGNYVENASEDKIKVEAVGNTKNGELILKLRNEDDIPAYIRDVTICYKNEKGENIAEKKLSEEKFVIDSQSEIYVHNDDYYKKYTKYKDYNFLVEMWDSAGPIGGIEDGSILFDTNNIEVHDNDTGEKIIFEIKNKTKYDLGVIKMSILFYKNNKIVDIANASISDTIYRDTSGFLEIDYPIDNDTYNDIEFDEYKVQFNCIQIAQINDNKSSKIIKNIEIEQKEIMENGDIVLKIKNNNNELVKIDRIDTIYRDENGKCCEIESNSSFKINSNEEVFICNNSRFV